jgi:hypothetical protein
MLNGARRKVNDAWLPLLRGSPKRELREFASLHMKQAAYRLARASGFTGNSHLPRMA